MTAATLEVEGLGKAYGNEPVFEGLCFKASARSALTIVGPSGCGKSSLLHILAGLSAASRGRARLSPPEAKIALMMQQYGLFPWKTVKGNLELPLQLKGRPASIRLEKVEAMLGEMGLKGFESRYPAQLSGGQQQRLALGRALIAEPDLLLLDEPFSSLDAITRESLQNFLLAAWRKFGLSYILTTHSIEEAVFLGRRILVMGSSPESGKAAKTAARPFSTIDRQNPGGASGPSGNSLSLRGESHKPGPGFIGDFDNPFFGDPQARLREGYFHLVTRVRRSLALAFAEGEADE